MFALCLVSVQKKKQNLLCIISAVPGCPCSPAASMGGGGMGRMTDASCWAGEGGKGWVL